MCFIAESKCINLLYVHLFFRANKIDLDKSNLCLDNPRNSCIDLRNMINDELVFYKKKITLFFPRTKIPFALWHELDSLSNIRWKSHLFNVTLPIQRTKRNFVTWSNPRSSGRKCLRPSGSWRISSCRVSMTTGATRRAAWSWSGSLGST